MKKKVLIGILIAIGILIIIFGSIILWYNLQLNPVDKNDTQDKIVQIETGKSTDEILNILKEENLVKNKFVAKVYIKLNNVKGLQAGKYSLNSSMNLEQIMEKISSGNVINEQVTITFLEGKNIRWIANKIAEKTNNTEAQVYEVLQNKQYIQSLIDNYWFLTDEITKEGIYYPLEGYLYPETYSFEDANVTVEEIFEVMLKQTEKVLNKYKDNITSSGATVHQMLSLASIVELEGKDKNSRAGISSVIYNRLKNKMSIGSDVTTYYAIKVDMGERDLYENEINTFNPYNTRGPNMAGKLPIGPISNISEESINAALNPSKTNYLYFVADINGKIYFTSTYEEHQEKIQELQKQGLWYEYNN